MALYNPQARDEREAQLKKLGLSVEQVTPIGDAAQPVERLKKLLTQQKAAETFIASVDWALLKEQYDWLSNQQAGAESGGNWAGEGGEHIEGLLNLLGSLQGLAVAHFGVNATTVFGDEQE